MTSLVLWADNFDETAEFYRLLLNARFENKSDDFVSIVSDANEVLLHRVPAEWASVISVPPVVREENPLKPCFEVASIDEARTAVAHTNGLVFASDREQAHGSKTYCDGFDPEGNVIQLFVLA
jgi:predicted enzyme related to lactoylglutathione lyase